MNIIFKGIKVLVVEDSQTQAENLKYLLEQNGMEVFVQSDGKSALEYLEKHLDTLPDIIISDIMMPVMDGYTFCRKVKSDKRFETIPFIILTELSDPEDVIKGLEAGTDNFLTKPYDEKFLLSRIEYILVNRKIRESVKTEFGLEIMFKGKKHYISSNKMQIIDLLLSTYETAVQKNKELIERNKQLEKALEEVKQLKGLIPICASCKKIRDDDGYWEQVEDYISTRTDVEFSHSLCPDCMNRLYPEIYSKMQGDIKMEKIRKKSKGKD